MPMTPAKLIQWCENLAWSRTGAADALGISFRAFQYLEAAVTSRGRPLKYIPKLAIVGDVASQIATGARQGRHDNRKE